MAMAHMQLQSSHPLNQRLLFPGAASAAVSAVGRASPAPFLTHEADAAPQPRKPELCLALIVCCWHLMQASAAVSAAKRASPAPFWTHEGDVAPQPRKPATATRPQSADRVYPWSWSSN